MNTKLDLYVSGERAKGLPDETIRQNLKASGWSEADISDGMKVVVTPTTQATPWMRYILFTAIGVGAIVAIWYFVARPKNLDDSQIQSSQTEQSNGNVSEATGTPAFGASGVKNCNDIASTSELNAIFGVGNFSLQTNTTMSCVWATSTSLGPNDLVVAVVFGNIGAAGIKAMENSAISSSAKSVPGIAHAYFQQGNDGALLFKGDYNYSIRTPNTKDISKLSAIVKLIDSKN